mgnify:CR=1 FL=1
MADFEGVAPPGWEKSIKRMKRSKAVDNPFALSWWLKNRGVKPAKEEDAAEPVFDAEVDAALHVLATSPLPAIFMAAARGEPWAHVRLLDTQAGPLLMEQGR